MVPSRSSVYMFLGMVFLGQAVAGATGGAVDLRCIRYFEEQGPCSRFSFSRDGRLLFTASSESRAFVREARTGEPVQGVGSPVAPASSIRYGALSPDGELLLTWRDRGELRLWETATGRLIGPLSDPEGGGYVSASFSPDSKIVAVRSAGEIDLVQVGTLKLLRKLRAPEGTGEIVGVAISKDGNRIAYGTRNPAPSVRIADMRTGKTLAEYTRGIRDDVTHVHWVDESPSSSVPERYLLSLSAIGYEALLFDSGTPGDSPAKRLAVGGWAKASPDGRYLIGKALQEPAEGEAERTSVRRVGETNELAMWDVITGRQVQSLVLPAGRGDGHFSVEQVFWHRGKPFALLREGDDFSAHGAFVIVDLATGRHVAQVDRKRPFPPEVLTRERVSHQDPAGATLYFAEVSPDASRLAVAIQNGRGVLFDLGAVLGD